MKEEIIKDITEKVMVKLAKHNVELGVVDDLKKLSSLSTNQLDANKKLQTVLIGIADSINNKLKELDATYKNHEGIVKSAENLHNNFKNAAKDLGIDYKNTEANKIYESILANALKISDKEMFINSVKTLIR